MEIQTRPFNLDITDPNTKFCPKCNKQLDIEQHTRRDKTCTCNACSWSECGYCRYSDRPFAMGSSSLANHYGGGCYCKPYPSKSKCECKYTRIDIRRFVCINCRIPKCEKCKEAIKPNCYYQLQLQAASCAKKIKVVQN